MGFAGLTVPTTVLSPTLPQQLNMHFLKCNNTLSPGPLYFIFIGKPLQAPSKKAIITGSKHAHVHVTVAGYSTVTPY